MHQRMYARADVLVPVRGGRWDLVEIKMGSSVKEVNYPDIAFQRYCYEGAGVPVRRCYLMHVNRDYVRHGEIDPDELFVKEDMTDELPEYTPEVPARVADMLTTIAARKCPAQEIGPHCDDPYECPLKHICWAKVWEHENNVFTLRHPRGRQWDLYGRGILRNDHIPADYGLNAQQSIQVQAERTGKPHIDKAAIRAFIDQFKPPIHFMDFETFGITVPIPLIDNTRPYDQVPFQFSVHTLESLDAAPSHVSWLWDGTGDPRPPFVRQLKAAVGTKGSIVVYNRAFEATRLRECAVICPEYAPWITKVLGRLVDLYDLFRSTAVTTRPSKAEHRSRWSCQP